MASKTQNGNNSAKVALVTGSGARRVGNVVAEVLGRAGYQIALHYNRSREPAEDCVQRWSAEGIRCAAFQADLADESAIDEMFDGVAEEFGRLDLLVTSASIWDSKPLEEVAIDDLRRNFDVNTLATFLCARRGGLMMVEQSEGGSIVTIGDWSIARPYRDYAAYFVSKGAIPTLTQTLAVELAERNPRVRVNCLLPGPVMFPEGLSEENKRQLINSTLLKRADEPESVARAVLMLAENEFITGAVLPVDAGRTIYSPQD